MFWRFGGYASISTLDSILDKPDVTVEELLDESDLIQELKQQNSKLVEFLRDEPVLKKLLDYVTAEEEAEVPKEKEGDDASKTEEEGKTGGIPFFGRGNARSRSISLSKRNRSDDRWPALRAWIALLQRRVVPVCSTVSGPGLRADVLATSSKAVLMMIMKHKPAL